MFGADLPGPNENVSTSYGLVRTVEHHLGSADDDWCCEVIMVGERSGR